MLVAVPDADRSRPGAGVPVAVSSADDVGVLLVEVTAGGVRVPFGTEDSAFAPVVLETQLAADVVEPGVTPASFSF